ncbi:MAG: chromosome segregation protein SMC [Kiritimatiellae bacterium]|nr:chromosome segregation protein SMC [Kiritimatiellia bacterium]
MYLKQLEMIGFKSFADRTRLEFIPGMTAIVGPNGCGKSNVSDAVRWVLGEQSAKALRGSNMQDVIFNGTDFQKPMGMAEVSLTLADCEETLGTEFNEITITRRVLRSGEGQYFINRAPCRLKDIQRLFMDTGIGTNAYSVLEQGRIDRILSSRPEDRREVFEEASGITKYKADKKEALRKLEHTEANLLRLEDIITEVKRQIISLQRQAGKARRYREMHAKLRMLDIFVTRARLTEMTQLIQSVANRIASLTEKEEAYQGGIRETETTLNTTREQLHELEGAINETMDNAVQSKTELDRTRQTLTTNRERIEELIELSERNTSEAQTARDRLELHQTTLNELVNKLAAAQEALQYSETLFQERNTVYRAFEKGLEEQKEALHSLQNESLDVETKTSHLQNELADLESRERGAMVKRERLMAEHKEMKRSVELHTQRVASKETMQQEIQVEVLRQEELLNQIKQLKHNRHQQIQETKEALNTVQNKLAAKMAQIDMLKRTESDHEPFPGGARFLMENFPEDSGLDKSCLLGSLADQIEAEGDYRRPLEAVMRSCPDALIVKDRQAALQLLDLLQRESVGAVRFVICDTPEVPLSEDDLPGESLIRHVTCGASVQSLMSRVLDRVRVISSLEEIPADAPDQITWVTHGGIILHPEGCVEYWMPESETGNPLPRKHLLSEWTQDAEALNQDAQRQRELLSQALADDSSTEQQINEAQESLLQQRRELAMCQGETQQIQRELKQCREREETIDWELGELQEQDSSGGTRRLDIVQEIDRLRNRQADVRATIQLQNEELRKKEADRNRLHAELTDSRIAVAEKKHQVDQILHQEEPLKSQIRSLEQIIEERSRGISSYQKHIENLQIAIAESERSIAPLEEQVTRYDEALVQLRNQQRDANRQQASMEEDLRQKRQALEEVRQQKSQSEVQATEHRMRRQNVLDRIQSDYQLNEQQLAEEPAPEWEENEPCDRDTIEINIAELRTKISSMGPVNLVAIEEHQELEERFQFLTQQQDDLVNAKQQLIEMIKKINITTTELFSETFNKVNDNFQEMFKQLFGGGSAKLVLVNEEDILESGIEIIARPPGKKLQNISLLSGGERTMTAVGLLFALYTVKPSPFCVLDELDAALDDSNIGRFVKTVQGFLNRSQFIVITHSRQTISASDILYGVTMEKHGVSKVVAVRLADHEKGAEPNENEKTKNSFAGKQ